MTESVDVDTSVPHSARVWNYWLGGSDNFPAALGEPEILRGHRPIGPPKA